MINSKKITDLLNRFKKEKSELNISEGLTDELSKFDDMFSVDTSSVNRVSPTNQNKNKYSKYVDFDTHELMKKIETMRTLGKTFGIEDPFFKVHDHTKGSQTFVNGKECINYSSYNYLGFNDHPLVREAAKNAIDEFGTSVGASRLVAGERNFQRKLEKQLADFYKQDDAITFVSGHATNVSLISTLFGSDDLIIYDALDHNSIIEGIKLSGAKYFPYSHNDLSSLENLLKVNRDKYQRVLIVTEGLFSMDGDIPNLPKLVDLKNDYGCILMIDEAHALGVLGKTGKGIAEHFNISEASVDIWMGTLSKTLASCGGYIAASQSIIDILRYNAPGFVFSVGLSAPMAISALTSLQLLIQDGSEESAICGDIEKLDCYQGEDFQENLNSINSDDCINFIEKDKQEKNFLSKEETTHFNRICKLKSNGKLFFELAKEKNLNTGKSAGFAVIPIITGSSHKAIKLSNSLFNEGINVQPIIHPAVEEKQARLRFFITSEHTEEQIRTTINILAKVCQKEGVK